MDDSHKEAFSVAIGALCASFGTDGSKALFLGYWMGLRDLGLQDLQNAVERAIRECDHLPRPAELRKFSGEQSGESRAVTAWGDVQRALPLGPYKHIDFEDKLVNAVVRNLGGWPNFCERFTDAESEKWVRFEFLKCYQAFSAGGVNGELCAPLAGLSQLEAIGGKVGPPQPRLVHCDSSRSRLALRQANPLAVERIGSQ